MFVGSQGDFVRIVAKKKATIPPKSYRADRFDQGFTALSTKISPLWGFWELLGFAVNINIGSNVKRK